MELLGKLRADPRFASLPVIMQTAAAGKEQVIHVFRAGESFAEASLASPTGYPANARCVEAGTVLLIPKTPILALIGRRPDLALRMLGSMSSHLRVVVGMLDDLTLKDVETRKQIHVIKESLARLSVEFGRFDERMKDLAKHIRQAYDDVERVQVTSGKISQRFAQIEGVELDDEAEEAKVLKLHNDRLRDGG